MLKTRTKSQDFRVKWHIKSLERLQSREHVSVYRLCMDKKGTVNKQLTKYHDGKEYEIPFFFTFIFNVDVLEMNQ